jgi:hypothetical protein
VLPKISTSPTLLRPLFEELNGVVILPPMLLLGLGAVVGW